MKIVVKLLVYLVGIVVLVAGVGLAYLYTRYPAVPTAEDVHIQLTPERLARGQYLVDNVVGCVVCHADREWTQYSAPVIEPRASDQPEGTSVVLDYRGASTLTNTVLLTDSIGLDAYGNRVTTGTSGGTGDPTFFNGDATWKSSLTTLNGARFFQVRITFISNAETNLSPQLSALGFTYRR